MSDDKPLDLTALSALEQAATLGPWSAVTTGISSGNHWHVEDGTGWVVAYIPSNDGENDEMRGPDAEFIAALRNATPDLIAENARLQRERDEARKVVAVVDDVRQGAGWTVQIYGVLIAQCDIYGKTEDVRRLEAENDALRAQIAWWEEKFPCDGLCSDAPEEDCSRHGRTPVDLWERYTEAANAAAALRATLARVEALAEGGRQPGAWVYPDGNDNSQPVWTTYLRAALDNYRIEFSTRYGRYLRHALTDAAPPATDPSEQEAGR